jgi:hypothetical protein
MRIRDSPDVLHSHLKDVMRARITSIALAASLRPSRGAMGQRGDRLDRAHDIPLGAEESFSAMRTSHGLPDREGLARRCTRRLRMLCCGKSDQKPIITQMGRHHCRPVCRGVRQYPMIREWQ